MKRKRLRIVKNCIKPIFNSIQHIFLVDICKVAPTFDKILLRLSLAHCSSNCLREDMLKISDNCIKAWEKKDAINFFLR